MPEADLPGPVVVLTGAGLSTDSGIPDFRSPGGVWDRFDPMEFAFDRFRADPDRFWERRAALVAAMDYLGARPNAAHRVLARAVLRGDVATLVTQNVDGLHALAGTPEDRLVEVHGNGRRCRCIECGRAEATPAVLERRRPGAAPRCLACDGLLKPDVVLFREPVRRLPEALRAVGACRSLVALGTSLQVFPVAGLVGLAQESGARVVIGNREPTPFDAGAVVHRGPVDAIVRDLWPQAAREAEDAAARTEDPARQGGAGAACPHGAPGADARGG